MRKPERLHYDPGNMPDQARLSCTRQIDESSDRTTPTIDLVTCPGCIHAMIEAVVNYIRDLTPL